jgi:hypothetical protein
MLAFDVGTPSTARFVFEFRDAVAEKDGLAASENFVTEFVGFVRTGCEGRDAGRDFRVARELQWYSS